MEKISWSPRNVCGESATKQQPPSAFDDEEAMPMFSDTVSSSKCSKEASPPPILRFRSARLLNQSCDNSPLEDTWKHWKPPANPRNTPPSPRCGPGSSCRMASGRPAGCRARGRRAPSKHCRSARRPAGCTHGISFLRPPQAKPRNAHIRDPVVSLLIPMQQPTPN